MKRYLYMVPALVVYVTGCAKPSDEGKIKLPGSGLGNFFMVDTAGVYRSDQPSAKDFALLEGYGIREVLNLRNYHSDARKAGGTSLALHRIKSKAGGISTGELTEALRIIIDRQGPILIHCWHGSDRTGAVVAMYRMVVQGVDREEAICELTEGGFGYHRYFSNIPKKLREIDIEAVRRDLGINIDDHGEF